jgi:hypothetical protein
MLYHHMRLSHTKYRRRFAIAGANLRSGHGVYVRIEAHPNRPVPDSTKQIKSALFNIYPPGLQPKSGKLALKEQQRLLFIWKYAGYIDQLAQQLRRILFSSH